MNGDEGAISLEYGLMATLIAVAVAVAVGALGAQVLTLFQNVFP